MKRIVKTIIYVFIGVLSVKAQEKNLDFWDEALRLFGTASASQSVEAGLSQRMRGTIAPGASIDHANHKVGSFSIRYAPGGSVAQEYFGFVSGLWGEIWKLSRNHELKLWIQVDDATQASDWAIRLIDKDGSKAHGRLTHVGGGWKEYSLPLKKLSTEEAFQWEAVRTFEIKAEMNAISSIYLDGVCFTKGNSVIGVTDKPLSQRIAEAEANRAQRIEAGLRAASKRAEGGAAGLTAAFNKMMLNEDLEWANQTLRNELLQSSINNTWSLFLTPAYCRFYYWFSNTNGTYPGRMTGENEKLLLETLWERTKVKNDIHWARQSTWYLDGSENHDLNAKACNLVTSRIFMNEPDYKDRIYPDYGYGGAYHYGPEPTGYYGPGVDPASRHGGGRANLSDGKEYTAKDHYEAWLDYIKEYFRGRAERGFFLEYASNTYSKHTLNFVDLAYQYSGDEELKALIGDFITLYWAEWAQVSISGDRGGPKTRHHKGVMGGGAASLVSFKLGGSASAGIWSYWNVINDHKLPPVVWKMILDREGMGHYTYLARGIGEEENVLPRPLGAERSMMVDTDARFLKSTYVTPDYTLGTQMDHPSAVHSHLSIAGRWHGMTFAQNTKCRIVPVTMDYKGNKKTDADYNMEGMWQTAHHEQTLIVQQARRWYAIHPDWYPANIRNDMEAGIWMGKDWDRKIEQDGWIFVQCGQAYGAVRPLLWDEEYEKEMQKKTGGSLKADATVRLRTDAYSWDEDGNILMLEENHMPVVIEAGHQDDYMDFEAFMVDVLNNPLELHEGLAGAKILVYTGTSGKEMTFGCAAPQIPTVGGEPVDYSHPMTFDSPYLKSEYKSGKIYMEFGGESLDLDFSEAVMGPRPNIVFLFADDWGRHASVYGDGSGTLCDVVSTPNFDHLAESGVLFRNAYVSAPSCTPCRSSILSGQHFWRTGYGAILQGARWDASIPAWPLLLEENGYLSGFAYKVWGPGTPKYAPYGTERQYEKSKDYCKFSQTATKLIEQGMTVEEAKEVLINEVRDNFNLFLQARKKGQPFAYWFGPTNTHRKWIKGSGKALWGIDPDALKGKLPPFIPDVPEIREDLADYLGEAQALDLAIGVLVEELKKAGEYENTVIAVSGDHGAAGFPHGKCNLYDFGSKVALSISGPGITGGRVVDDFVSLPDLAPTFLEAGAVGIPETMTAKSIWPVLTSDESGWVDPSRAQVYIGRERHVWNARAGALPYPQRAVRTKDYLLIINFKPDRLPLGDLDGLDGGNMPPWEELEGNTFITLRDEDAGPTKAWMIHNRLKEEWKPFFERAYGPRPMYELYDLKKDPDQMNNVAYVPEYQEVLGKLKTKLLGEMEKTGDPRLEDDGAFFEEVKKFKN